MNNPEGASGIGSASAPLVANRARCRSLSSSRTVDGEAVRALLVLLQRAARRRQALVQLHEALGRGRRAARLRFEPLARGEVRKLGAGKGAGDTRKEAKDPYTVRLAAIAGGVATYVTICAARSQPRELASILMYSDSIAGSMLIFACCVHLAALNTLSNFIEKSRPYIHTQRFGFGKVPEAGPTRCPAGLLLLAQLFRLLPCHLRGDARRRGPVLELGHRRLEISPPPAIIVQKMCRFIA